MDNYFKFFDLEPAFGIDQDRLKKAYLKKSREYHPDYFTLASDEEKRIALEMTTKNNTAYKVLSQPSKLLEHILRLHKILGSTGEEKMDPVFLMEMMEINEQIMEVQMEGDIDKVAAIKDKIQIKREAMDTDAATLKDAFDNDKSKDHLRGLKSYYFKKKYIARIMEQIEGNAPEM